MRIMRLTWDSLPTAILAVLFVCGVASVQAINRHLDEVTKTQEATRLEQFAEQRASVKALIADSEARKLRVLRLLASALGVSDQQVSEAGGLESHPPLDLPAEDCDGAVQVNLP